MENIKNVFKALPHVNEVWVTKDGNFHLHPHNGGEKVSREDVDIDEQFIPKKTAKEIIDLINSASNEEEVISISGNDNRKTVKEAAENKIASFKEE